MKRFLFKSSSLLLSLLINIGYIPTTSAATLPTITLTSNYPVLAWVAPPTNAYYNVKSGAPAQITWSTTNADSVVIDHGVGAVAASGSLAVPIQGSPVFFTVTASNASGSVSSKIGIQVYQTGSDVIPNINADGADSLHIYSTNENTHGISPDQTKVVPINTPVTFYAEFKKGGAPVSGADCRIIFTDSNTKSYSDNVQTVITSQMVESGSLYTHTRSFPNPINMVYDVVCTGSNLSLSARDFTLIDVAPVAYYYWRNLSGADKQRLIGPEDIEYLGAFQPSNSPGSNFGFGLGAMAYNPKGDPSGPSDGYPGSLFAWGRTGDMKVSEITVVPPVIPISKQSTGGCCGPPMIEPPWTTTLQSFADVSGGILAQMKDMAHGGYNFDHGAGLMYLAKQGAQTSDKLYWSYGNGYPAGSLPYASAGWSSLDLTNPQGAGPWKIGGYTLAATAGYLFAIDKTWADTYTGGRYLATGQSGSSITSSYSHGPAIVAYGPWLDGNPPAANTEVSEKTLLFYPPNEPEHNLIDADGSGYSGDGYGGGAWIAGTKSGVGFVRNKLAGGWFYEAGRLGACSITTGDTIWPRDVQLIFYDPNELAQVATGAKQSWEPKPYLSISIRKYFRPVCEYGALSMTYDKDNGLIFVAEPGGESPVIHVFQVADSSCRKIHTKTAANLNASMTLSDTATCAAACNTSPTFTANYKEDGAAVSGAACSMTFEDGVVPMTASGGAYTASKSFAAPGTYQYTVECSKAGVNTVTIPASLIVSCGSGVPLTNLFASPQTITVGMSSTLTWSAIGATSVSIDHGIGTVSTSGSQTVTPSATTTYTITATNGAGTVTRQATITVDASTPTNHCGNTICEEGLGETIASCPSDCKPPTGNAPTITAQPAGKSVGVGQPATFNVTASGAAPLLYQWESRPAGATNFSPITGATGAGYTFSAPQSSDSGTDFRCVVSNSIGSAVSNPATLTVFAGAPVITQQPQNQNVTVGQMATFVVSVTGFPPLTYQWQSKTASASIFSDIAGANAVSYKTPATTLSSNGTQFRVVITNSGGATTSSPATLTVTSTVVPPTIVQNPQNQSVTAGQNGVFTVTAAGSVPLAYQWQSAAPGSSTFNTITGATGSSYTALSVTPAMNGTRYRVRISNSAGAITSGAGLLTVNGTVIPPTIQVQPQSISVSANQNANFQVLASGSDPLSYQWQMKGPAASSFTNIQGATSPNYTQFNAIVSQSGTQFRSVVSNAAGSVTSSVVTLTVTPAGTGAPVLNLLVPINGSTVAGSLVTAAYYSSGDLSGAHHVLLQLDSDAPVQGQSLSGVYTFTNVPSGTHLLTANLASSDNTPIPGTITAVSFTTTAGAGNPAGPLPPPSLSLPPYVSVDGSLSAGYPAGYGGIQFAWTMTLEAGSPPAQAGGPRARTPSGSANFQTTSNIAGLKGHELSPGYYRVAVYAMDALGNASAPAQGFVTLVTANLGNARVFPNPWRADRHPSSMPVTFDRLALGSTVKLFTVSGHWIKTLSPTIDTATWDLTNDKGDKVASGIYVYVIKAEDEKVTGQVHIIK